MTNTTQKQTNRPYKTVTPSEAQAMQIDSDTHYKHPSTRSHLLLKVDNTPMSAFVMFSHNTPKNSKNTPAILITTTEKNEDAKFPELQT